MKCPTCGTEYTGDTCPLCGGAESDAADLFEAAFQQYTGYANDLSGGPADTELFETPPVPETAPLEKTEPLPKADPWKDIRSEAPPVPETAPLEKTEPLPKADPWKDIRSEAPPVPKTAPLEKTEPLPKAGYPRPEPEKASPETAEGDPDEEPPFSSKPQTNTFVRICPRCGRPLTPTRRYCGNCGYDSGPQDTRPGVRVCPVCGHRSKGMFCGKCGRDLSSVPVKAGSSSSRSNKAPAYSRTPSNSAISSPCRKWVAVFLCLIFGVLGLHRMYVGKWGSGILCLFCCGFSGLWPLIDLILILTGKFTDKQGRPLTK